ncbi:MAG: iron ABC transporter permease [Moheibacter sp.]
MKFKITVIILILLIVAAFLINLNLGSSDIRLSDWSSDENARQLIFDFRLPRTIAAFLAGIALPISGLILQELFRNPLADPSVLGITSASGLGVALVIFLSAVLGFNDWVNNSWLICIASFLGAISALAVIVFFSARLNSTTALIIIGIMIAGFAAAIIGVLQFFAPSEKIKTYLMWTFGSVSGLSWSQIFVFSITTLFGLMISIFTLKGISGLRLGENYAYSMGINVKKTRWLILVSSAVLTASATAFVGPIAFIGLAIPHICRIAFRQTEVVKLYILVILLGIFSMLLFSWISQIFPKGSLPINIITSLIGAPIVMSILLNRNQYSWND